MWVFQLKALHITGGLCWIWWFFTCVWKTICEFWYIAWKWPPMCKIILSVTGRYNFLCSAFQFTCNLPLSFLPTLTTYHLDTFEKYKCAESRESSTDFFPYGCAMSAFLKSWVYKLDQVCWNLFSYTVGLKTDKNGVKRLTKKGRELDMQLWSYFKRISESFFPLLFERPDYCMVRCILWERSEYGGTDWTVLQSEIICYSLCKVQLKT